MNEHFSANICFQVFFKLSKTRAITLNKHVFYRDDYDAVKDDLELRLHELWHCMEQDRQGFGFYVDYFKELDEGHEHREEEDEARKFANQYKDSKPEGISIEGYLTNLWIYRKSIVLD